MAPWSLVLAGVIAGSWLLAHDGSSRPRGRTLFGFVALAIGMTAPLALQPGRLMLAAGAGPDAFIGLWNLWWTRTALEAGLNPFFCDRVFAPAGTSLALHTHAVTYGVLTWPWQRFVTGADGLFAGFNLAIVASFTLTGWLGYRLARSVTGHHEASVLAGALFAYTTFRFANTVRLHVLATEWLVLFVWAAVAFARRPTALGFPALIGSAVLLVHASLEYSVHAGLLAAILVGAEIERRRKTRTPWTIDGNPMQWAAAALLAVAGFAAAIPFVGQLRARLAEGTAAFDPGIASHFSADVVDFVVPNPRHPLWGSVTEPWTAALHAGDSGYGLSLGLVALAGFFAAAATLVRGRFGRAWLAGGLVCAALALGPDLRVNGTVLSLPMPHDALTTLVPFLRGSRTPIRWIAPAGLCLSIVVAIAWSRWRPAAGSGMSRVGVAALGLLLFESLAAPLPMTAVAIPDVYREIASAEVTGRTAVLHVPELPPREKLLYQTAHGRPLVGNVVGAVPHRSPSADATIRDPAWSILLREFGTAGWFDGLPREERARAIAAIRDLLERSGVRWIVVSSSAWVHERRGASRREVVPPAVRSAFLENLRALGPVRERNVGEEVLLEL